MTGGGEWEEGMGVWGRMSGDSQGSPSPTEASRMGLPNPPVWRPLSRSTLCLLGS